jgi:hypothetical protein
MAFPSFIESISNRHADCQFLTMLLAGVATHHVRGNLNPGIKYAVDMGIPMNHAFLVSIWIIGVAQDKRLCTRPWQEISQSVN